MTDYENVNIDKEHLVISGYDMHIVLYLPGVMRVMNVRDFKKMLSVVQHQVSPAGFKLVLDILSTCIAHFPGMLEIRRLHLQQACDKKYDALPGNLFMEDFDDE